MSRYKLIIQYDGALFFGWQMQTDLRTVQGEIENALKNIYKTNDRIPVYGSGRTDTGVHAIGQVAHFDIKTKLPTVKLKDAINANLSDDCRIISIEKVLDNFHARFSALKRHYRYQCFRGNSILYRNQAWCIRINNINRINRLAKLLIGNHDFTSFSKKRINNQHNICEIFKAEWKDDGEFINFFITGNRFLHHMVRYLVGTMVQNINGDLSENSFHSLLSSPQKDAKIYKAPPQGLILEKVDYFV